jgi:HD-GYP domain-containing protein (c-di-GMP phosphodiesterase class II)
MNNRELHQLVAVVSAAAEARDFYTAKHQSRVSNLARFIAQELNLPSKQIEYIRIAGLLHDIGKLGVPSAILSKAGKLRKEEFDLIKLHSIIGEDILKRLILNGLYQRLFVSIMKDSMAQDTPMD